MEKFYIETNARSPLYSKYKIYNENGVYIRSTSDLPDGLKRAAERHSNLAALYDNNINIGEIAVLGTLIPGAAQVAAEAFKVTK